MYIVRICIEEALYISTSTKKLIWPIDTEPMLSILKHPRLTILFALRFKPLSYFIKVGIIGSFASSLIGFIGAKLALTVPLGDVIYSSFITSILMYFVSIALLSGIAYVIGAAFNGKGKFRALFRAMSLTVIPYIWILPIILFWMQLSPLTFFTINFDGATWIDVAFSISGGLAIIAATIWTLILTVQAVSIVHQFSKWKSAATCFFMLLIVVGIFSFVQSALFGFLTV